MATPTVGSGGSSDATAPASTFPRPTTGQASPTTSSRGSGGGGRVGHNGTPPAGALTTAWKPPCGDGPISWDRVRTMPKVEAYSPCLPEGWATTRYFSPAICPSGYVSVCSRFNDAQGPSVEAGETAVMCGPPGFTCDTRDYIYAKSNSFDAPMVQIRWQSSDLSVFQTHPLTPTSPLTTGGGDPSAAAATALMNPADIYGAGAIPPGLTAAIIVGSMAAVALAVLGVVLLFRRTHRHDRRSGGMGSDRRCCWPDRQPQSPAPPSSSLSSPSSDRQQRLHHPLEAELQAHEASSAHKEELLPFYSSRRSKGSTAMTAGKSHKWHKNNIQELPGHNVPLEIDSDYLGSIRPAELPATAMATAGGGFATHGTTQAVQSMSFMYDNGAGAREKSSPLLYHYDDEAYYRIPAPLPAIVIESVDLPVGMSRAAAGVGGELEALRARQAQIEARRERLRELQQLDEEEGAVQRRLEEIQRSH